VRCARLKLTQQIRYLIIGLGAWIIREIQRDGQGQKRGKGAKGQNGPPVDQPSKVSAVVSFDDKTAQINRSEADRQHRTQKSLKNASWFGFIAAVIYAGIAAYQAYEMRMATLAAQQSASAAAAQLEATDRPWIKVIPGASSPLTFKDGGLSFIVKFDVINVGRSVATSVGISALAFVPSDSFYSTLLERQSEVCNRQFPYDLTMSLFPNETRQTSVGMVISREEMEKNGIQIQLPLPLPSGKRIELALVGCAHYRYASLPRDHQTGFIYTISRSDPSIPSFHNPIIVGQDVPIDRIYVDRSDFGGDAAN
jgi:hypothetical protein